MKRLWLLISLLACFGCNKTYTAHGNYTEGWYLDADRGIVKTVTYEWKEAPIGHFK